MKAVINLAAKSPVLPEFPPYGIGILESHHSKGFVMASSCYRFSEVMLILEGNGWIKAGDVQHPVEKGNLIAMPAGTTYSYVDSAEAPLAMLSLCIVPANDLSAILLPVLPPHFMVLRNAPFSREVIPHFRAILHEQSQGSPEEASLVVAHTLLILSKLHRRYGTAFKEDDVAASTLEVQLLARVRDYIAKLDNSFHEAETIRTVAERLGMSPRSFTDYFRNATGLSRHQYIQKLRLKKARHLLAETEESITSIAFTCGFEDLSTFFRAFRLEEKLPPAQWRKNHREEKL